MAHLRIGSRGSQLALWQANHVAELLRAPGHSVEIEVIKTTGDKILDVALSKVGTKGMFTKEIEEALRENRVDLAVHSLKDLPTELEHGFELACVMPREDARDAFVSVRHASLLALPQGAHVGTSSLRRQAQLKAMRSDLRISPLRGNVDTRLRKMEEGEYDAIILASAGLNRLGKIENIRERLSFEQMCPAAGQGALGIEIRAGDSTTLNHIKFLDDSSARTTAACERAALNALGGGCQVPIGAHARMVGNGITLMAVVASPDGTQVLRDQQSGTDPHELGVRVGKKLLKNGAQRILDEVYSSGAAVPQQP